MDVKRIARAVAARVERLWTWLLNDQAFLTRRHLQVFGRVPDWDRPKTSSEKVLWRIVFERPRVHTKLADKYGVRDYVRSKIGEEYLAPLLGVYDSVAAIDFDSLPRRFVLKCSHDCGSTVLCRDKTRFNRGAAKRTLRAALKRDFSRVTRENHYRGIPRRILCEPYLIEEGQTPIEYRFYMFGDHPVPLQQPDAPTETASPLVKSTHP